jgi:hypothetical protein
VEPPHLLVLHSTTHLPLAWKQRLGASIDWAWTFTLAGGGDGGTRLLLRVRGRTGPWWLTAAHVAAPRAVRFPGWCGGRGRRPPRRGGSPPAW